MAAKGMGGSRPGIQVSRVATRYDKLAVNFLSAIALATIIAFWI
jgi:hypothetical protein